MADIKNKGYFINRSLLFIEIRESVFAVNHEILGFLKTIESDVKIISMIGQSKSGKTFLLNNLTGLETSFQKLTQFNTEKVIEIWIFISESVIFIDSIGLDDELSISSNINLLLYFISSMILVNSFGPLDLNFINSILPLTKINDELASSILNKDAFLTEISPKLIFSIRDFDQNMIVNHEGKKFSAKDYLEIYLRKKQIKDEYIKVKEKFQLYFNNRDLIPFPYPFEELNDKLKENSPTQLNSEFRSQLNKLKEIIKNELYVKRINGKKIDGITLSNLILLMTESFNSKMKLNFNALWTKLVTLEIDEYYKKSLEKYKELVGTMNQVYEEDELLHILYDFRLKSMLEFNKCVELNQDLLSNKIYFNLYNSKNRSLEEDFNKTENFIIDFNKEKSKKFCTNLIKDEFRLIEENSKNLYYGSNNIDEFVNDLENFQKKFFQKSLGEEKINVLLETLLIKHCDSINSIIRKIGSETEKKSNELSGIIQKLMREKEIIEKENKYIKDSNEKNLALEEEYKLKIMRLDKEIENAKKETIEMESKKNEIAKNQNMLSEKKNLKTKGKEFIK